MAGSRTLKLSILADVDNLKKNLDSGSKDVQTFGDKIEKFGKVAGAAFLAAGVAAAAYAGKLAIEGVKAAIEDEAAQAKLATTLRNVTGATDDQIKAVEEQILKTSLLTGKTDDELRPSFDRLLRSTKDVTAAQKLQSLALDISAGTGKELSAVSEALGKAYDGNLGALKRLGVGIDDSIIKSKDFDAAAAALASTFKDQASAQADTFQGKMLRLTTAFDEAKETVGSYILDGITPLVTSLSENLFPIFTKVNDFISDDLIPTFKEIWAFLKNFFTPVVDGIKSAFDKVSKSFSDNSDELKPLIGFMKEFWEFSKTYLAPFVGGALKLAFQAIGTVIAALVNSFSTFVGLITKTYNGLKNIVDFIKNNPVVTAIGGFFGGDNSKGLKAGGSFGAVAPSGLDFGTTAFEGPSSNAGLNSFFGLDPQALSPVEYSRRLQELMDAGIVKAGQGYNASTGDPSPNAYQNYIASINVSGAIDPEGTARTIIKVLNDSSYRGTGGANGLVIA